MTIAAQEGGQEGHSSPGVQERHDPILKQMYGTEDVEKSPRVSRDFNLMCSYSNYPSLF